MKLCKIGLHDYEFLELTYLGRINFHPDIEPAISLKLSCTNCEKIAEKIKRGYLGAKGDKVNKQNLSKFRVCEKCGCPIVQRDPSEESIFYYAIAFCPQCGNSHENIRS